MSDARSGINGPKGQIWIVAALTLPYKERIEAMNDIADMLGTTYAAVQSVASRVRARAHTEAVQAGYKQDWYMRREAQSRPGERPTPAYQGSTDGGEIINPMLSFPYHASIMPK